MNDIQSALAELQRKSELERGKPSLIVSLRRTKSIFAGCLQGYSGSDTLLSDRIVQTQVYYDLNFQILGRRELTIDEVSELAVLVSHLNANDDKVPWTRTIFCAHQLDASSSGRTSFSFSWPDTVESIPASVSSLVSTFVRISGVPPILIG